MTENNLIITVGRILFGDVWQSELARAMRVSDRTVRRWASGRDLPHPGRYADLLKICRARSDELQQIVKVLEKENNRVEEWSSVSSRRKASVGTSEV